MSGTTLDGWKEIASHLENLSGIRRSVRTIMRWARRDVDPLPVRRTPGGDVFAQVEVVNNWWRRASMYMVIH